MREVESPFKVGDVFYEPLTREFITVVEVNGYKNLVLRSSDGKHHRFSSGMLLSYLRRGQLERGELRKVVGEVVGW